jgi:hypothetical protein
MTDTNSASKTSSSGMVTDAAGAGTLAKITADIEFLRDRISQLKSHRNPNTAVLHTYTSMLARREVALALMQNGGEEH